MKIISPYPKSAATVITVITLVTGAAVVVLADFGAPVWVFAALLLWPATVGLPSTLAVLLLASLWGHFPLVSGLPRFVAVSALLAWLFQWAAVMAWNRWRRRREVPVP